MHLLALQPCCVLLLLALTAVQHKQSLNRCWITCSGRKF
jgi:hypothetical protein